MTTRTHAAARFATIILGVALIVSALVPLTGCGDAEESTDDAATADPMHGFSWIVPGKLAAMPVPGRERSLAEDAAFLEQQGIRVLISLTEEPPERAVLAARSIDQRHIPLRDFTAPTLEQISEFVAVVEDSSSAGKPVGVHCTAGLGRSGTMAAAYLVSAGATADEAIDQVRRLRPGSIETEEQEESVRLFERHRSHQP